jgi:hypothetical protein
MIAIDILVYKEWFGIWQIKLTELQHYHSIVCLFFQQPQQYGNFNYNATFALV